MTLVIYDMLVNKVMLYTWADTSFHKKKNMMMCIKCPHIANVSLIKAHTTLHADTRSNLMRKL
jgi:hypothetical protein